MTPSKLGQATLQALKCLKPSGEKSFEKLTATLLSQLIGMSIRLCKSGYQGGIDALAEIPIAIEDKRSQAGTLDLNELRGKLAEAARIYPDLQLWVLTATVSLDPFNKHALEQTAELLGLGVLILDSATAQPELPDLAAIVALCASSPEETLKAIATQDWLDSQRVADMPAITEVQAELEAIRALPRFTEWLDRLRAKLIELPLWQLITNRQNRRLTQILEENAYIGFGTAFDSSTLVPRTVKSDLNAWFPTAMESSDHEIAVVLGERYDGKTWLVFD
jgi:hypothetical protein